MKKIGIVKEMEVDNVSKDLVIYITVTIPNGTMEDYIDKRGNEVFLELD